MREYQVAIVKMGGTSREDEETLTDLLNERARAGWTYETAAPLDRSRVAVIFAREAK